MSSAKPFYLIAHRVLTVQGVRDALANGANALEIDMTAWKKGWWADHDGLPTSAGDTAEAMFIEIAAQRNAGQPVTFVWLDIKNPNYVKDPWDAKWKSVSVIGLRDLARKHLEPVGVRVMFGFYDNKGANYQAIVDGVNELEAVNLDGNMAEVQSWFEHTALPRAKRVMSKGLFNTRYNLFNILGQLRLAAQSHNFGQVFGWTVQAQQGDRTIAMLETGVDGVIYGFEKTAYYDHEWTRSAAADIKGWVERNNTTRRMAGINDNPW